MTPSVTTAPVTAPVAGPIRDRAYWTAVIHNAAKVTPDDPRYADARAVAQMAITGLQDLADSASAKDITDISPGKLGTAVVSFGHGASLGLAGDPTYLKLAQAANPKTALAGDILGTAALAGIASPAVEGLTPATGAAVLGGTLGAARGAIEPVMGLTRKESAALMGIGGAVTGAAIGKFAAKLTPMVRTVWGNISRALGPSAAPADIASMTEAAIRAQLGKLKVAPDVIEQAIANLKTTGALSVRANPVPTVRPGETIVPAARPAPDPMTEATFLRRGTGRGLSTQAGGKGGSPLPDIGGGRTLPYYPRGGQVEQAFGPSPATSPVGANLAPQQMQILQQFLQGATPANLAERLSTIRALGIALPPDAETQLLAHLVGGP